VIRLGFSEVRAVETPNINFDLFFPLPEILLCDCAQGDMYLTMPDTSTIPTTATCKFHIRRINPQATTINLYSYVDGGNEFYNEYNSNVSHITGIGNVNIWLILYNRKWYFSQYG